MKLNLKPTDQVIVELKATGYIEIKQYNEFGPDCLVNITLEQFRSIQEWVDKNQSEILKAWNSGAEDA